MKKFLCITMLLLITVFVGFGCQKNHTAKQKAKTDDTKVEKTEKLKTSTQKEFYQGIGKEDWREPDILQITDNKIIAVMSHYFLVLNQKNGTYKIQKIIDLHPYEMAYYYNEQATMFFPSKDGERCLIYNECRYDKKDHTINAADDKDLKSIVIDLKKDQVTYRKGNQLDHLKKKEGLSENNLSKTVKVPKSIKQYAHKNGYILSDTEECLSFGQDRYWIMKSANEESIFKCEIYRYHEGKIKCIFKFEQ